MQPSRPYLPDNCLVIDVVASIAFTQLVWTTFVPQPAPASADEPTECRRLRHLPFTISICKPIKDTTMITTRHTNRTRKPRTRRAHPSHCSTEMSQCRHCKRPFGVQPMTRCSIGCPKCRGSSHLITSSARNRIDSGMVMPRALAVLRLTTSSNLVGCSIGKSPA